MLVAKLLPKIMPLANYPLGPDRLPGVKCKAEGCIKTTREGKPFCQDHVHLNPYVMGILNNFKKIEKEKKMAVKNQRAIKNGFLETDFLNLLRDRGPTSLQMLNKLFRLSGYPPAILQVYVAAAVKRKLIKLNKTSRGGTLVTLIMDNN